MNALMKLLKLKTDKGYSVKIIDQKLIDLILELCGDSETRKIIICLFDNDLTIPQILKESKVPKTSGYRKIENLIINGLILDPARRGREGAFRCVQCVAAGARRRTPDRWTGAHRGFPQYGHRDDLQSGFASDPGTGRAERLQRDEVGGDGPCAATFPTRIHQSPG